MWFNTMTLCRFMTCTLIFADNRWFIIVPKPLQFSASQFMRDETKICSLTIMTSQFKFAWFNLFKMVFHLGRKSNQLLFCFKINKNLTLIVPTIVVVVLILIRFAYSKQPESIDQLNELQVHLMHVGLRMSTNNNYLCVV